MVFCDFVDDNMYRQALFGKYGIRECFVKLERISDEKQAAKSTNQLIPTAAPLRAQVSWLPAPSATRRKSVVALSELEKYREKNDVVPRIVGRNIIRQRAKSIFAENPRPSTINDLNQEFVEKYNSPNHGLKPCSERQLYGTQISGAQKITDCQKIRNEFEAKLAAKKARAIVAAAAMPKPPPSVEIIKPKLSWNQLKALVSKNYPTVECNIPTFDDQRKMRSWADRLNLMYL